MPSVESLHAYSTVPGAATAPARELSRGATKESEEAHCSSRTIEEERILRTRVSVAKLLMETKEEHQIEIETASVYGSAFVMPQIARSTRWSPKLVVLCARCYFFLIMNCLLQWMLVYELMKEAQVMNRYAGVMWLCDFGAQKTGCPEADGCIGPGGTRLTPGRTYSFSQQSLQSFAKASLAAVFPDRVQEIDDNVDAGEYGLESQECRILCIFLFVFAVSVEFAGCMRMMRLLYMLPCHEQSWVNEDELGEVELGIRGMPRIWKFINIFCVLVPRFFLWQFTARTGILFLLETASIEDTIVNTTALCFILDIDELLFDVFSTELTKHMLEILEGFHLPGANVATSVSKSLSREEDDYMRQSDMNRWCSKALVPWNVIQALCIFAYFYWLYYASHCVKSSDGTYVSISMYTPLSTEYSNLAAFIPQLFPIPSEPEPYWTWSPKE